MKTKIIPYLITALICSIFNIGYAVGAEVTIGKEPLFGDSIVDISGPIEKGDLNKIKKVSAELIASLNEFSNKPLTFYLNTPGGDIEEAIKIGQFAREILATVDSYGTIIISPGSEDEKILNKRTDSWKDRDYVILSPDEPITEKHIVRNYSAGILIFYGAVKRGHRDNSDQRLGFYKQKTIPVMGIHRPYYESKFFSKLSPSEAEQAYKNLEKLVRNYLSEMGAPQELIERMFNKASNDIELVRDDEFRKYYKPEESFLEEWLISKCGATGQQNILKDNELSDFNKIKMEQIQSRRTDQDSSKKSPLYLYPSVNFQQNYVEDLFKKVRNHNVSVNSCRAKAVALHQREWANNYKQNKL